MQAGRQAGRNEVLGTDILYRKKLVVQDLENPEPQVSGLENRYKTKQPVQTK